MKKATFCANEAARIKALLELKVLDSAPELAYDDLVLLASEICQVPIALVSLTDHDRQWFKAKVGLDAAETPRDVSFCGHAIQQQEIFEICDSLLDPRFADNPLATGGPLVRFYAGAPLIMAGGEGIGTLCVIDHVPRKLTDQQRKALLALSRQVVANFQSRRDREELKTRDAELKKALDEVYRISTQNQIILDNMEEGVVYQGKSGEIVFHNHAAQRILGLSSDQLLGKTSMDPRWKAMREDGSDFPGSEHPAMRCLKSALPIRNELMGLTLPSGSSRWISINSAPVLSPDGKIAEYAVTTFADVTTEREKSALLNQASKMALLGVMAGGIAHEINTPLATLKTKSELMLLKLEMGPPEPAEFKQQLGKVVKTVDRIAEIVKALRIVSRESKNDKFQEVEVLQILHDSQLLCEDRLKSHNIAVSVECDDVVFDCRPGEICQVVLNLIGNAQDAIDNLPNKWIRLGASLNKDRLLITVTDSGDGIAPQVADRMMDPFFTTKEVGKGTGLGLSVSRALVLAHKGFLYYNKKSKNTQMVIDLPIRQQQKKDRAACKNFLEKKF